MIIGCRAVAWQLLFCRGAAVTYDDHSAEDHDGGKDFLPCKYIHSYADAYDDCDYRLDITVHADKCRSYAFLAYRYEEVGDEGGTYYQICQF